LRRIGNETWPVKKALTAACFQRRRADLWFGEYLTHNAGRNHGQNYGKGRRDAAGVRDAVGLKPGDVVDVQATASGGVYIEKPGTAKRYRERLKAIAKQQPVRGITTEELMEFSRGERPAKTKK
jgi:antitoxin PrlF